MTTTDQDSEYFLVANTLVDEAKQLISKANNKVKLWFTFILTGDTADELYTDAIEKLTKASTLYRINKNHQKEISTLVLKASVEEKVKYSNVEKTLESIGDAYSAIGDILAVEFYKRVLNFYKNNGQFDRLHKLYQKIYEFYIGIGDNSMAISTLRDTLENDHLIQINYINKFKESLAILYLKNDDYLSAQSIYDTLGKFHIESIITRNQARQEFMMSVICLMANEDFVGARNCLNTYINSYTDFADVPQSRLLGKILDSIEEGSEEKFATELSNYDSHDKLTNEQVRLLLRIKKIAFREEISLC